MDKAFTGKRMRLLGTYEVKRLSVHQLYNGSWYDHTDGKIESDRMPHSETLLELSIFDAVRRKGGYVFSKGLEKIDPVAWNKIQLIQM